MVKITELDLRGFRGARGQLVVQLPKGRSLLLHGENGSGKSSNSDGIEWFYFDRVDHLSSQEIGRNGIPALRNHELPDDEDASVSITLTDAALSSTKRLSVERGRLVSAHSNDSPEFEDYLHASAGENIVLRYRDLLEFVLSTKKERLAEISGIIGFGDVTKSKAVLKKAANDLRRLEKARDYDRQISRLQADIIDQLGQNVTTEDQFVTAAGALLESFDLGVEVTDTTSLARAMTLLKGPGDDETIHLEISCRNVLAAVQAARDRRDACSAGYRSYREKHEALLGDAEKLATLGVEKLLSEGLSVLEGEWEQNACPLCLQNRNRNELVQDLRRRREGLAELRSELAAVEEARAAVLAEVRELSSKIDLAAKEPCLAAAGAETRAAAEEMNTIVADVLKGLSRPTLSTDELPEELPYPDPISVDGITTAIEAVRAAAGEKRRGDDRFVVNEKLSLSRKAYADITSLRAEQQVVRRQLNSMDMIYREFVKREGESLLRFLDAISAEINDLYLFMNADDRITGIRLVPVGDDEEFAGVTLEMTFHGEEVSPPEMYLSESHVNCLGICLFLASVKAFNQVNGFFVLDDVISSFDTNHRMRFGHLLRERFADRQILVLTHERDWFDYMTGLVKGSEWEIRQVAWDSDAGTVLRPAPMPPREAIEEKLAKSDTDGAGNDMRRYLEGILKQTCLSLGVRLRFLRNDRNEDRMPGEMLAGLVGTLKQHKCELKDRPVLGRLAASAFVINKSSHDSPYTPTVGDLKAVWRDILEFEGLVHCGNCAKLVDATNFDAAAHEIGCKCGNLKRGWHK
jgi:hypothetical protein